MDQWELPGGPHDISSYSDYAGTTAATTVYVEVDGDVFMWNVANWDLQESWDLV